jgi:uncharacterized membrane protein YtjA (UPF0391 family)
MLYWALVFLIVALVAAALGFGGIAGASAGIVEDLVFRLSGPAFGFSRHPLHERLCTLKRNSHAEKILAKRL